jgi:nudix-type nucleoside diphosphatase (YffH/AdpP family)
MSAQMRREVFVATDAALVLPYDPVTDRVLLVEQFRMGPYGRGDTRPWMLEPVAGRMDAGETPEQTARRECLEEAGLELRALEMISSHYCTPGYSTEYFHLFLGLCDLPAETVGQGGLASEQEDIRTHIIGYDRAMALVASGEANNGPLILGLLWLERERARLRASA